MQPTAKEHVADGDRRANLLLIPMAALAFGLYLIFCETTGWTLACLFHLLTGLDCPGCGCQRAFHACLDGQWMEAWRYNLILPFAVAYIILLLILPFLPGKAVKSFYGHLTSPTAGWLILSIILLWWIIRNAIAI